METLLQDLKYGFRTLLKSRAFTLIAVISLALGIGANTTIFTLINAVFLHPIPVREPARLMSVFTTDEQNKGGFNDFMPTSYPNFQDYRDQNTTFEGMSAYAGVPLSLSGSGEPVQLFGTIVSGNYFDLLGVTPALGRAFLAEEDRTPGTHPVAILSHGLWTRRFGADPGIIGRILTLNGVGFTVIGVAREGFQGTNVLGGPDLWVPMMMHPQLLAGFMAENFNDRRALLFNVEGRLKPGVSQEQALAELKTIGRRLEQEYPEPNKGRSVTLLAVTQSAIHPALRRVFMMAGGLLMTVVALVLLIACANVANLLLARATARRKEIAIRLSLGAGRGRLMRQLLTESVMLALLGGGVGLLIAAWGRDLLLAFRPPQFQPENLDLSLDARVLGFTLAVSLLTGLLFGLAPALQASRQDLVVELKDRTIQPGRAGRRVSLRGLLVVGQVALSLISLIGAGLFLRSLQRTQGIDPGFETKNLMTLNFDLGAQGYDVTRGREYHRRVLEEVATLPGVRAVSLSTMQLFGGGAFMRTVFPEGQEPSTGAVGQFVFTDVVTTGSLDTRGVALKRGRALTEADREGAPRVVVVNEAMAERFWKGQDVIGKRFKFFGDETFAQVVGVAENTKVFTLGEDPRPIAYVPVLQAYEPAMVLNVRTEGDPVALMDTVRRRVQALEPTMPLTNIQTVADAIRQTLWAPRMGAGLLAIFGGLALVLAAVGLYGVMSYSVGQRTHEFGIRMALGARRQDVLGLVLKQGMILVGTGVALGLLGALGVTHLLSAFLVGVSVVDPATFAGVPLLLLAVALLAGYIPARRATRVDPMIALRYE